jgi:hypothetical protein
MRFFGLGWRVTVGVAPSQADLMRSTAFVRDRMGEGSMVLHREAIGCSLMGSSLICSRRRAVIACRRRSWPR